MNYSEFVKAEMLKLKNSSMAHKEKFKHIAELWKKSGHSKNTSTTTKVYTKSKDNTELVLLKELGIKKEKPKKALNNVVKALERLKKPEMKVAEELILAEKDIHKHPMYLLEKKHERKQSESDNENDLGF